MRKIIFLVLFQVLTLSAFTQFRVDSLHYLLQHATKDSSKLPVIQNLAAYYTFNQFDSAILYAKDGIELANKLNNNLAKFGLLNSVLLANNSLGNYSKALEIAVEMLRVAEQLNNHREKSLASAHHMIGLVNREMENYPEAYDHLRMAILFQQQSLEPAGGNTAAYSQIAMILLKENQLDSALWYAQKGVDQDAGEHAGKSSGLQLAILGNVQQELGNYAIAEKCYREAIVASKQNKYILARSYNNLAGFFGKTNLPDSCIRYAFASLQICKESNYANYALDASSIIVKLYESRNMSDSAYKYLRMMMSVKDTLFSQQKSLQFQMINFDENQHQQVIAVAQERYRNQIRTYSLIGALVVFLVIAFILFRNNRLQKKSKLQIEKAYSELKSTQAQLIQSEKMASLGELTAGIAHEIQNPLNFVNNFSEVNNELLLEMKEEIDKGNAAEAKSIADNIIGNGQKILTHGKRADAIVKGMLQHSRESKGQKESTDLNALADEYLRLSFQGLRAKDKSFNAKLKTEFDPSIGKINIIPQDIGRVLLNLYNNAFYAVVPPPPNGAIGNKQTNNNPTVWVTTKKFESKVMLSVRDNGPGISQKVVEKIFQPFFTTKPTGQGTGLGLSLAYDIIKAHGGEIRVETREGEGAEFIIQIPIV